MLDAGIPATQCHQYASGTPYGDHYSVEIENAEIILDIDTPDDFITAQKRYTKI